MLPKSNTATKKIAQSATDTSLDAVKISETASKTDTTENKKTHTDVIKTEDNPVALKGTVKNFPQEVTNDIKAAPASFAESAEAEGSGNSDALQGPDIDENEGITSENMVPAEAVVSLFTLDDVDYQKPIATVATDAMGDYEVRAEDVREYLMTEKLAVTDASDVAITKAFKALGQIQVRALIVKEDDSGESKVLAIQSIADPNEVDAVTGEPVPVVVDPIVHRAVKAVIEQIREAIGSLRRLGVAEESVGTLTKNIIKDVLPEIRRVIRESAKGKIEIPIGKSPRDVIAQHESESEVPMDESAKTRLKGVFKSKVADKKTAIAAVKKAKIYGMKNTKKGTKLISSLGSSTQGMLSGLKTRLNDRVSKKVDNALEGISDDAAAKFFGVKADDHSAIQVAKAARIKEKVKQEDTSLRQFFMNMGLSVIMETNEADDTGVVAIYLPLPSYMEDIKMIGGQGSDRNVRLFTLGEGELDTDSLYTTDITQRGGDHNLSYAPRLSALSDKLFGSESPEAFQQKVDEAYKRVHFVKGEATSDDFSLLEQVNQYHMLNDILENSTLISQPVLEAIREHKTGQVKLKTLAAVIAKHFHWATESVNLTKEGFPVFTDRRGKLPGKGHRILPAEVVKALNLRLGKSAKETANLLTEQKGFYAQFATEAILASIQQADQWGEAHSLFKTLTNAYPKSPEQYKDLIAGSKKNAASMSYASAKSRVMRGIMSAIPADLFGQKLTSETTINLRSALFFLDYVVQKHYVIHEKEGFFKAFELTDKKTKKSLKRAVPHFKNIKYMESNEGVTPARIIAALLNRTLIEEGAFFMLADEVMQEGLVGLPDLPEFDAPDIGEFDDELDAQQDTISASCVIERHDPSAPIEGDKALGVRIFSVTYDDETGIFQKEEEGLSYTATTVPGSRKRKIKYLFEGIPAFDMEGPANEKVYGRDYVMRFDMPGYKTELPELFFWGDGYMPEITLCDEISPLFIGPDRDFDPLPSLGILSDQQRPFGDGATAMPEGFDISNFEKSKAPIYLTKDDEREGLGHIDAMFVSTKSGYALKAFDDKTVGFAPLYGSFVDGKVHLSLDKGTVLEPLYGIQTLMGINAKEVVKSLLSDDSGLKTTIEIDKDPSLFKYGRLYVMRDRDANFWIIEAGHLDVLTGVDGKTEAVLDFLFAKINQRGEVVNPELSFNDNEGFFGLDGGESFFSDQLFYQSMRHGDWLVLLPPAGYEGPTLLPAESMSIRDRDSDYRMLASATDGIVVRFGSADFDRSKPLIGDSSIAFDSPVQQSIIPTSITARDMPLRLEAGRKGITFAKLRFDRRSGSYVLMQKAGSRPGYVAKLTDGDIVVVFGNNEAGAEPTFLGRVVKHSTDKKYAMLGIEWVNYDTLINMPIPADIADTRHVICTDEENPICLSERLPLLHHNSLESEAIGVVFDVDNDGVPALFDLNDDDPNIPNRRKEKSHGVLSSHLRFMSNGDGGVKTTLLVETHGVYPGSIKSVDIQSVIFGEDTKPQTIFTCRPPRQDIMDAIDNFSCTAGEVDGGVSVTQIQSRDKGVKFALTVPENTLAALEGFITLDYAVSFNAPTDREGNAFMCGKGRCQEEPAIKGRIGVLLPRAEQIPDVFTDLSVTNESGSAVNFSQLSSLDVTQGVSVSAKAMPDAEAYTLSVSCPAASTGWLTWMPEEDIIFETENREHEGVMIDPSFDVYVPWLGGKRICTFTLSARFETNAGDLLGESVIYFDNIQLEGEVTDDPFDIIEPEMTKEDDGSDGDLMTD